MQNKPYVKQYENGELLNPLETSYLNQFENRKQRRMHLNKQRDYNNRKGTSIRLVSDKKGVFAYVLRKQYVTSRIISPKSDFFGEIRERVKPKLVLHYDLKNQ